METYPCPATLSTLPQLDLQKLEKREREIATGPHLRPDLELEHRNRHIRDRRKTHTDTGTLHRIPEE